jgi:uncharacterized protein (TIGR03435 family)
MFSARALAVLLLFSAAADAQLAAPLHFESASIRPVPAGGDFGWSDSRTIESLMTGERLSDGTLLLHSVGVATLLTLAFPGERLEDRFLDIRRWISKKERFELIAQTPPGSGADKVRLMIQSVLIEQLHLAVHRESKNLKTATLIVAKGGAKLLPATGTADGQCEEKTDNRGATLHHWTCENVTMEFFAQRLSVFDATGLDGTYDLAFHWQSPIVGGDGEPVGDPQKAMSHGLEKALGLKLETRTQSIPVVVVDHLDSL